MEPMDNIKNIKQDKTKQLYYFYIPYLMNTNPTFKKITDYFEGKQKIQKMSCTEQLDYY